MFQDSPITKSGNDKLNRGRFVNAVVEEIKTIDASRSFTIGMYGKWGTGKTSLINLFREKLNTAEYFTTYFNPWRFKNEEMIIKELFLKILKGIQSDKKLKTKSDKFGELLKSYSKFIFFSDTAKNIAAGLGEILDKTVSLEEEKEKINEILVKLEKPLIIFIDDIDRLDNLEIQQIFKILKLTADFNKLIYVLAFDEEMVAKPLSQIYGNDQTDGLQFIEKIIQLPLRIPRSNDKERFQYTFNLLADWMERKKLEINFEQEKLNEFLIDYTPLHNLVVKTPRDSKRLINSISFVETCLRDEVNVLDIVFIETIRIFIPKVFHIITEKSRILFSKPSNNSVNPNKGRFSTTQVETFIKEIEDSDLDKTTCEIMMNYLFPLNDIYRRNYLRESDDYKIYFQNQRLGIPDYFYRYLEYKLDDNQMPDKTFKELLIHLETEENYDNLKEQINEISKFSSENVLRRFFLNIDRLNINGKKNIIKILATEKHFLPGKGMKNDLFQHNIRFPMQILKEFDKKEDVGDILNFIMKNNESIYYFADFIRHAKHQLKSIEGNTTSENELEKIENKFVNKILSTDITFFFNEAQSGKNASIFEYFDKNGKLDYLKKEILKYLNKNTDNVFTFLKTLINPKYEPFTGIKTYTKIEDKSFEIVEKYIYRNDLIDALKKINSVFESEKLYKDKNISSLTEYEQIVLQYIEYIKREDLKLLIP